MPVSYQSYIYLKYLINIKDVIVNRTIEIWDLRKVTSINIKKGLTL